MELRDEGPQDGAPLVLIHGLGTDLDLWEALIPRLPKGLRVIRYDLRGHGQSPVAAAPYGMGALVHDAESLLDARGLRDAVVMGLGLGGLVAQGLAVKRLDLVRALVLASTAAKLGRAEHWDARADRVERDGVAAISDDMTARWYGPRACHGSPAQARHSGLLKTDPLGFAHACRAIAGTDFYTPTSGLRLPCLGLAGADDAATPPDLVRETVDLIPGARFTLIRREGHFLGLETGQAVADALGGFLADIGHRLT